MNPDRTTEGKHHFYELAQYFNYGMFISVAKNGMLHSRPMAVLKADENEGFWLISSIDSPKSK